MKCCKDNGRSSYIGLTSLLETKLASGAEDGPNPKRVIRPATRPTECVRRGASLPQINKR